MKTLYLINFFIFKFYEKKDPDPYIYSFFGSSVLVSLNFISLFITIQKFMNFTLPKYYSILILVTIFIINYFLLYQKQRYKVIFENFSMDEHIRLKLKFFKIYFILTILVVLFAISWTRLMKFGGL